PDPITITAAFLEDGVVTTRQLPTLVVSLKSADLEQIAIGLKLGRDYRLPRAPRWRFEVTSCTGRRVPIRPNPDRSKPESQLMKDALCVSGATLITHLPMERYVSLGEPGEYTVTILYHNNLPIADLADTAALDDLIIFRSAPFKLTVEKGEDD